MSLAQKLNPFVLETERTYLREWTEQDLSALSSLFCDPVIMSPIGVQPLSPVQLSNLFLYFRNHYRDHRFGPWAVISKETNEIIGINGVKYFKNFSHADLGYAFLKGHQGQGLATETSLAVLSLATKKFGIRKFGGIVLPTNLPSIHVLKKVGMTFDREVIDNGVAKHIYALNL